MSRRAAAAPAHRGEESLPSTLAPVSISPEEGPLGRIRQALPRLNGTAKACAEYVLTNPWQARGLSIVDLAAHARVSTNAVNRFARGLGYKGYRDFSNALALELGTIIGAAYSLPRPLTDALPPGLRPGPDGIAGSAEGTSEIVSRVLALEIEALQDAARTLDRASVRQAVDMILEAKSILFIGTGTALGLCDLAAYRLKVLGLRTAWAGDPGTITPEIHVMEEGDVVVAISHHGIASYIIAALEDARARGLRTICVTAVPESPAAVLADIQLLAIGQQTALGFGQFASRIAAAALLEALAAAVAWRRGDEAVAHAVALQGVMQKRELQFNRRRGSASARK